MPPRRSGIAYKNVYRRRDYFFLVSILVSFFSVVIFVSVVFAIESAGLAGGAVVVSTGAGAAGAGVVVVVEVVVESTLVASPSVLPPPQEAAKIPNAKANTLNFTNFINLCFSLLYRLIPEREKGNPQTEKDFSVFLRIS